MNKIDLARAVAEKLSTTYTLSYDYINTIQQVLTDELQKKRTYNPTGIWSLYSLATGGTVGEKS